jgi:hypothetical protein
MSMRVWRDVETAAVQAPDWGLHYGNERTLLKLVESVERHGQVQALVVRTEEGGAVELVDGRMLLEALRRAGVPHAHVLDLGHVTQEQALRVALSLETRFETDFVKVAGVVEQLADTYESHEEAAQALSKLTPYSPSELRHFITLLHFDWKQFAEEPSPQTMLLFGEEPAETVPALGFPDKPLVPAADAVFARVPDDIDECLVSLPDAPAEPEPTPAEVLDAVPGGEVVDDLPVWAGDIPDLPVDAAPSSSAGWQPALFGDE